MGSGTEAAIGRVGGRVNLKSREGERKEGRGGKGGTLLYSVAAMLAITGPCYTVMFQLSPTWLRLLSWQLLIGVLSKITFTSPSWLSIASPSSSTSPRRTGSRLYLLVMPSSCTSCIPLAALLHRCVAASLHLLPFSVPAS
ncbi:hypothetical protein V8C86DRAFT_2725709 [Haematococcus lacustris]